MALSLLITIAGSCVTSCSAISRSSDVSSWSAAIGRSRTSWFSFFRSSRIFDQTFCVAFL